MRDVSPQVIRQRRRYGGSDRVAASFNASQYVRHASIKDPFSLGILPDGDTFWRGVIGGESGSQSLFAIFSLREPTRLGARLVPSNRYKDQYVSLSLTDANGRQLLQETIKLTAGAPPERVIPDIAIFTSDGYVEAGYWANGYTDLEGGTTQTISNFDDPSAPLPLLPGGEPLDAGTYLVVLSSSQWAQLPFELQLTTRQPRALAGSADLVVDMTGRTSLLSCSGTAELPLEPQGRVASVALLAGAADLVLTPAATLSRVSPFQA
jgi:hypothetical protein